MIDKLELLLTVIDKHRDASWGLMLLIVMLGLFTATTIMFVAREHYRNQK